MTVPADLGLRLATKQTGLGLKFVVSEYHVAPRRFPFVADLLQTDGQTRVRHPVTIVAKFGSRFRVLVESETPISDINQPLRPGMSMVVPCTSCVHRKYDGQAGAAE